MTTSALCPGCLTEQPTTRLLHPYCGEGCRDRDQALRARIPNLPPPPAPDLTALREFTRRTP